MGRGMDTEFRPMVWQIVNWSENFENNRTRELKSLSWVPFPNKHDGDGYTDLLDHKDGVAHFGAWCALVQVASKCEPRGTLVRDTGKPHDTTSLARMTRIPQRVLQDAIDRLIDIGWIGCISSDDDDSYDTSQESATLGPHDDAAAPQQGALNGRERTEGKEQKEGNRASQVAAVINHYKTYHPKANPGSADRDKIRARLNDDWTVEQLKSAIDGCHRSPFHCGQNDKQQKHQSLELIVRDSKHVQQFLEVPEKPPPEALPNRTSKNLAAAAQFLEPVFSGDANDNN